MKKSKSKSKDKNIGVSMCLKYRDTRNYSPIDVVKGIDLLTKEIVMADDDAPDEYLLRPKCKFCKNFSKDNKKTENLGICKLKDESFMAYPDMTAITCPDYSEK